MSGVTSSFGVGLTIRSKPWVVVVSEPSLSQLTNPMGKRACCPSLMEGVGKAKKNRGPPPPSDLVVISSKAMVKEVEEQVRASLGLGDSPPVGASEALKGREEGPATIMETQVEAGKAWTSMVESSMLVTRLAMKAKVKRVAAPVAGTVEGKEVRPSITHEGAPTSSKIHLLRMDRYLRFLDDSIPLDVKEEALERPIGEGLQWFNWIIVSVSLLPEGS